MTDIVEKLRQGGCGEGCDAVCREAADEIERLQGENDAWEATANYHYKQAFYLRKNLISIMQMYMSLSEEEAIQLVKTMAEE